MFVDWDPVGKLRERQFAKTKNGKKKHKEKEINWGKITNIYNVHWFQHKLFK